MSLDPQELLAVRLGSGRVYLIPRAVLEKLVHAFPVEAPGLIVSASTTGGPLDPSGLPQEAGVEGGGVSASGLALASAFAFSFLATPRASFLLA